jgi:hypothetical protein
MKREDFTIDGIPDGYVVYDVDLTPSGTPVVGVKSEADRSAFPLAITQHRTLIEIPEDALWPYGDGKPPLVGERYPPKVRAVGEKRVMVCRPRTMNNVDHCAWIWDAHGSPIGAFHGGDDTDEILANDDFILVFYNDEGQTGDVDLSREGLAVFSSSGEFLWGQVSQFPDEHLAVWFHAAAFTSAQEVAIWADVGSSWLRGVCAYLDLNLTARTQRVFQPPMALTPPAAVSKLAERVLFSGSETRKLDPALESVATNFFVERFGMSPEEARMKLGILSSPPAYLQDTTPVIKSDVVSWRPGTQDWEVVGSYEGYLRGLPGGRFISPKPDGYTILSID